MKTKPRGRPTGGPRVLLPQAARPPQANSKSAAAPPGGAAAVFRCPSARTAV